MPEFILILRLITPYTDLPVTAGLLTFWSVNCIITDDLDAHSELRIKTLPVFIFLLLQRDQISRTEH